MNENCIPRRVPRSRSRGEVLNFCANNYLGLADDPKLIAAAQESAGRGWLRHGLGALHLRHADRAQGSSRRALSRVPRHRGHDPLLVAASTPTAACSRRCSARRTRSSPTRSTTRRSSTASGSARRSGYRYANNDMAELEAAPEGGRAGARTRADRHRRRVLDGRHASPTCTEICDLADTLRRAGDGRRLARDRLRRARTAAARPSTAACWAGSTSSPARSARRSAARSGGYTAARKEIVDCCASARGRTCSRTRWRRSIAAATLRVLELRRERRRRCASGCASNAAHFRARDDGGRLQARAGRASDHPGDARRRDARGAHSPSGCSTRAST